jgi:dTDP-4-amino-4,6-dideoxygalactose transaminase
MNQIPFNRPYWCEKALNYIYASLNSGHLSGNGSFTKRCQQIIEDYTLCLKSLLTHSCTAALEMSAILTGIEVGDEVIMPSYTFVSTANAFVLRGAVPVFVDIRPDTLNIDENSIEEAITERTKAIVVVHYAGVACEMDTISQIAQKYNLFLIEDNAQGIGSKYKGKPLGSFGHLGTLSFHETKNIISGEGGALLINTPEFVQRAEIIWEKGTNRSQFLRGEVDKYTWVDIGSSYLPSDLIAAFLCAQLEQLEHINHARMQIWQMYHRLLEPLEEANYLRRPVIPEHCQHNAHLYYILLKDAVTRDKLLEYLRRNGVQATFHYVPLHNSPAGRKYGKIASSMNYTSELSERLLRLPLWMGMERQDYIISLIENFFRTL